MDLPLGVIQRMRRGEVCVRSIDTRQGWSITRSLITVTPATTLTTAPGRTVIHIAPFVPGRISAPRREDVPLAAIVLPKWMLDIAARRRRGPIPLRLKVSWSLRPLAARPADARIVIIPVFC